MNGIVHILPPLLFIHPLRECLVQGVALLGLAQCKSKPLCFNIVVKKSVSLSIQMIYCAFLGMNLLGQLVQCLIVINRPLS